MEVSKVTLDRLIEHEENVSKATWNGKPTLCAEEHRQLAEWLKELKQLREQVSNSEKPNKCGEWLYDGFCGDCVCSICKHEFDYDIANMRGFDFALPKYCPNCGAKMGGTQHDS